jgi:hypothetical protein
VRRRLVLGLLLGLLPGLAACSTVPQDTATVQITQVPQRPAPEVAIEPQSPEPGATPEEIVSRFIDAAASTLAGHPVAREYVTERADEAWTDEGSISVISQDYSASVTTQEDTVRLTADRIGTVDQRGIFTVEGDERFSYEFTLEEVEGEWRIANPPPGLILLQPDFERLYDRRLAYFLDPTGTRVVPDPRYLITGEAQPTALLNRVLEGPSAALSAGVRNLLSGEVQLRSAVTVNGQQSAVVDLTGLGSDPDAVLAGISAQVVWTLRQLGIQTVQIRVDGEVVQFDDIPAQQTIDDWASFDPDSVPVNSVGHYVQGGALRLVSDGEPAPGPAGEGDYRLTSAAVKIDARTGELNFLAGVGPGGRGQVMRAGPYGGALSQVLDGETLTAPTVAGTRAEVWVVRDGTEVFLVQSGGRPRPVEATTLAGLGRAQVLQLSPDGVRAAVVVDQVLYVGTIVRNEDGGVALRDLRAIAPTLTQVVDVAWRDSEELYVLAGGAGADRIGPYLVGVDGWGLDDVSVAGLPSDPTSIAAAPTRAPLVVANRTLWQLAGGTWVTLEPGAEPRPGSEPFYPL